MEADEAGGKMCRRPRLIETCDLISFLTKMKTAMRNALYFSAFELGTFSTALLKNGYSAISSCCETADRWLRHQPQRCV
jgi:hypothetical protein